MKPQAPAADASRAMSALELFSLPPAVYIVRRPTLVGVGYHYGVMMPDWSIVDFGTDTGNVMRRQDPFEFAGELTVEVVRRVPDSEHFDSHLRMQRSMDWPGEYNLLNWNCEHFATWLAGERPRSDQITMVLVVTAAAAALFAAAKVTSK